MNTYFHSVRLDRDKCRGCTNCIKHCPTEAIRVRNGKAQIIDERCIDCGVCIRVCPYHAKVAYTDPFSDISRFKYKIALPAPSLYGQFKNLTSIDRVLMGLKQMGFDDVYEVAKGADIVSCAIREKINSKKNLPIISSACPAIVRLIQVRFPNLIDNILDLLSPMEIAANAAKVEFAEKHGVDITEIGAFFITPCPAKMTSIKNPYGVDKSAVDGAVSVIDIYGLLAGQLKNKSAETLEGQTATVYGIGWANSGGECLASGVDNYLAVDDIGNVIKVLEEIENLKLGDLQFFEGLACPGGCVGGPLTFENPFVARTRIKKLSSKILNAELSFDYAQRYIDSDSVDFKHPIMPRPVMKIDEDMVKAMKKLEQIEEIAARLPGLDCGSCGSPSCRAMAEDIVRGDAKEMDCIFKLRDKVTSLAEQMVELTNKDKRGE
ncbi:MAG: [Fe-Fe] hydrogenase large subunit C-terminal domain-containing protein [Christensenellales bacterium]|jgi:iron only hydrogenase large subunit-like protein